MKKIILIILGSLVGLYALAQLTFLITLFFKGVGFPQLGISAAIMLVALLFSLGLFRIALRKKPDEPLSVQAVDAIPSVIEAPVGAPTRKKRNRTAFWSNLFVVLGAGVGLIPALLGIWSGGTIGDAVVRVFIFAFCGGILGVIVAMLLPKA